MEKATLGFYVEMFVLYKTPVAKQFLLKRPVYAQYSVLLRSSEYHENLCTASLPLLKFQGLRVTSVLGDGWMLSEFLSTLTLFCLEYPVVAAIFTALSIIVIVDC